MLQWPEGPFPSALALQKPRLGRLQAGQDQRLEPLFPWQRFSLSLEDRCPAPPPPLGRGFGVQLPEVKLQLLL